MVDIHLEEFDQRIISALGELSTTILMRYPDAQFEVTRGGDDPRSIYLITRVDTEETEDVLDLVIDRVLELQIEERLPIHVMPLPPIEQVTATEHPKQTA